MSQRIVVYGSSRTDAGVHAFGQVAHVDLDVNLSNKKIKDALNGNSGHGIVEYLK